MSSGCRERLDRLLLTEMRGDRLPYVVVYGAPYSGKTELLSSIRRDVIQRHLIPERHMRLR